MDEKKPEPTELQTDYIFEKMQNEIDRLTAENKELTKAMDSLDAEADARFKAVTVQQENLVKFQAELNAKDEILRELLAYAEEGLLIDEHLAAHIVQALKGGGLAKKQ